MPRVAAFRFQQAKREKLTKKSENELSIAPYRSRVRGYPQVNG